MKHTNGPWIVIAGTKKILARVPQDEGWLSESNVEVCEAITDADAQLIAAAPRLLLCLQALADRCAKISPDQKSMGFRQDVEDAFDAIAEAEGRKP